MGLVGVVGEVEVVAGAWGSLTWGVAPPPEAGEAGVCPGLGVPETTEAPAPAGKGDCCDRKPFIALGMWPWIFWISIISEVTPSDS
jgi:hypothetical protein